LFFEKNRHHFLYHSKGKGKTDCGKCQNFNLAEKKSLTFRKDCKYGGISEGMANAD